MLNQGRWKEKYITLSTKANCLTVSLQDHQSSEVYSYDLEGRLWTAMVDQVSYRRGLDGKVVAKWGAESGIHQRKWLTYQEAAALEEKSRRVVLDISTAIDQGKLSFHQPVSETSYSAFQKIIRFDQGKYRQDVGRYHEVYKPVGILPPDQYMAVVLQATEGCSFNTCTFCSFYRDRKFRIKTPEEFMVHAQSVRAFLGEGVSLRRTIFLGDANALVTPIDRLLAHFEVVNETFDVETMGGIFAFLDGFSGVRKSAEDIQRLVDKGLKRVYIGMESGSTTLLEFLKKPGKPSDVITAVRAIKEGGASVGIIVLLGAGGREFAREHIHDTIEVINSLGLDMDDLIYFSELIESEGLAYTQAAFQAGLETLGSDERISQGEEIEESLVFSPSRGNPHISRYDIREFVY